MSEKFDPYYTWLGIPPEEQPAHHYRLLGLRVFESNAEVISNALDQRLAHLKTLQVGKNAALSQTLLNEVSAAGACLLRPEKKAPYDAALKKQLDASAVPKAKPLPQAAPLPQAVSLPKATPAIPVELAPSATPSIPIPVSMPVSTAPAIKASVRPAPPKTSNAAYIAAGIVGVAALISGVIVVASMNQKPPKEITTAAKSRTAPSEAPTPSTQPKSIAVERGANEVKGSSATNPAAPPKTPAAPLTTQSIPAPDHEPAKAAALPAANDNPASNPPAVSPEPVAPAPAPAQKPEQPLAVESPVPPNPAPFAPMPDVVANQNASPKPGDMLPEVPTEEALAGARTQILDIFGKDAKAATKPELKAALADKMHALAADTSDNPAVRFVLMDNARKLYIGAGEVAQALQTTQRLIAWYRFDPQRRQDLLIATSTTLADANLSTEQREMLVKQLQDDVEAAVRQQQLELADQLSALRVKVATKLRDGEERRLANQQRTAVLKAKAEFAEFTKAQTILAADPMNASANLTAAKFLCTVQRDWKKGRSHLAAAGIESLKSVLATEEAAEASADNADAGVLRLAAGDAWLNWAETTKGSDAELILLAKVRAKHWFRTAVDSLAGLNRAKAEKRLEELANVVDGESPVPTRGESAPAIAKTTPSTSATTPKTPATSSTTPKTGSTGKNVAQSLEPGLLGRLFIDEQVQNVLLSYQEGYTITPTDTSGLLAGRLATQKVRIELEGFLVIPQDGEYTFNIAGGSASGGIHSFFVAGNKLSEIGDDRSKNDVKTISLAKGEYPLKFLLTGGDIGSAKVSVRPADSMAAGSKSPTFGTPKKLAANLRQAVKKEVAFGTAPAADATK